MEKHKTIHEWREEQGLPPLENNKTPMRPQKPKQRTLETIDWLLVGFAVLLLAACVALLMPTPKL